MRQERITHQSIDIFATHRSPRVEADLAMARSASSIATPDQQRFAARRGARDRRRGLPAEAVLRCALLKQYRQLSYEELAFHLEDQHRFAPSHGCQGWTPKKAVLQKSISAITAASWARSIRRWCAARGKAGSSRRRWFASTARSLKR